MKGCFWPTDVQQTNREQNQEGEVRDLQTVQHGTHGEEQAHHPAAAL
jgi:hypothetical protein